MKLSILIPSVPSRLVPSVWEKLLLQAQGKPVEVLMFTDNKQRSVGMKRQAMLDMARGEYVAFVDDDDDVADCYVDAILDAIGREPDVVTFRQMTTVNGAEGEVHFSVLHQDEKWMPGQITKRRPWHPCAWKTLLARKGVFTDKMFGEDRDWLEQVIPYAKNEAHIPRILHYYRHNTATSEAPPDA